MNRNNETNNLLSTFCFTCIITCFLVVATLLVYFLVPVDSKIQPEQIVVLEETIETEKEELYLTFQDYFSEVKLDANYDKGLEFYRRPSSKAAVELFYFNVTKNPEITKAILSEADKNDIPLSLAFALAHTESNFRPNAINTNSNSTVDRGLFQLNSKSFPNLNEDDFFDPYVSSKYGMSHLKFCLDIAGNEISALAMYNAGTNRVRSNKTPQVTLNYVGKIVAYQKMLDQMFSEQVVDLFDVQQLNPTFSVALTGSTKKSIY